MSVFEARRRWEHSVLQVIGSIDDAAAMIGEELGVSRRVDPARSRREAFADAAVDRQCVHVEKAKAESPNAAAVAEVVTRLVY